MIAEEDSRQPRMEEPTWTTRRLLPPFLGVDSVYPEFMLLSKCFT